MKKRINARTGKINSILLLFPVLLCFTACENPLAATIEDSIAQEMGPEASTEYYAFGISPTTELQIDFSKNMDTSTIKTSGTMAEEANFIWTAKDTLMIRPKTSWSDNKEHTIVVECRDEAGLKCLFDKIYGTLDGIVYVSPDGAEWNSGRKDEPVDSINQALWTAFYAYPDVPNIEIRVAEGTYRTEAEGTTWLGLNNNQHLLGGWNSDFSERNPSEYETVIDGQWDEKTESYATIALYDCGSGSLLDGFTIIGKRSSEDVESVVKIVNGSPTVSNNKILAYSGIGLSTYQSSPLITDNTVINWGNDYPHMVEIIYGKPEVRNNIFKEQAATESCCVRLFNTDIIFEQNRILLSWGVDEVERTSMLIEFCGQDWGKPAIIRNNIIDSGSGYKSVGIRNICSSPRILNNTVITSSGSKKIYGSDSSVVAIQNEIHPDYPAAHSIPVVINNIFIATGENSANHTFEKNLTAGSGSDIITHNTFNFFTDGKPADVSNTEDPVLYESVHRDSFSLFDSASVELRTGGADLSSEFQTDISGAAVRGGTWSRGAWQWSN